MTFQDLELIEPIQKAIKLKGYTNPSPIQKQAIPALLNKQDLLGCAQTGTGKTAAFALPILQHIFLNKQQHNKYRKIKALIITPTRELAIQIGESFTEYGKFTGIKNTVIFGGVKQAAQTQQLKNGIDILVATPGRLLDLMNQGFISLRDIEYFVLDEADHMLDMGFIHDIKKIVKKLPIDRQSLFFSATMPPEIITLSKEIVGNPVRITIKPEQATAEKVEQAVFYVEKSNKNALLMNLLLSNEFQSTLIFSRTKHGADKIVKVLAKSQIRAEAIHGNKSQNARQKALNNFKNGDTFILIATDIAARGIDVDDLALVINYDLPNIPETYVHRIGRTGRAKASGVALSFCSKEERPYLRDIQRLINQTLEVVKHDFMDEDSADEPEISNKKLVNSGPHAPSKNARKKTARRKNNDFKRNPKKND
ncbi:MAG: DEAD/DEAH box helicase [Lutibacter sp.]|nr:DEAD/DEAH box helicase [Lutibacter sp.]MBP9600173.1 DEAD/DEAH box helicase [Lutibacter sp.]